MLRNNSQYKLNPEVGCQKKLAGSTGLVVSSRIRVGNNNIINNRLELLGTRSYEILNEA